MFTNMEDATFACHMSANDGKMSVLFTTLCMVFPTMQNWTCHRIEHGLRGIERQRNAITGIF